MKIHLSPFLIVILGLFLSCSSAKQADQIPLKESGVLYGHTWQLEYLSDIGSSYEELFPQKKPELTFDEIKNLVRGNAGCNGYSATFTKDGDKISFSEPGPSTLMYCGDGEPEFLNIMSKINRYSVGPDGKLNLMIDDVPMLRFHKQQ